MSSLSLSSSSSLTRRRALTVTNPIASPLAQQEAVFALHSSLYGGSGDASKLTEVPSDDEVFETVERLYEHDAVYTNPLLEFQHRAAILDAFLLSRFVSSITLPHPRLWLYHACRKLTSTLRLPYSGLSSTSSSSSHEPGNNYFDQQEEHQLDAEQQGWKLVHMWSELEHLTSASKSYDNLIVANMVHTLHLQLLPTLFPPPQSMVQMLGDASPNYESSPTLVMSRVNTQASTADSTSSPTINRIWSFFGFILGLVNATFASLLHIRLRVLTLVFFNERAKIILHRDHWDIRDVLSAFFQPLSVLFSYIFRNVFAFILRIAIHLVRALFPSITKSRSKDEVKKTTLNANALGLQLDRMGKAVDNQQLDGTGHQKNSSRTEVEGDTRAPDNDGGD